MPRTYTNLLTHLVFSTKDRQPFLTPQIKPRLFDYLGGIIRNLDGKSLLVNGPADHVHILASLSPKHALSDFMRDLKSNSTNFVHDIFPEIKCSWQAGYGAFNVSHSNRDEVYQYIATQEEHHRKMTFQEEFIAMLKRNEIEYDERFIWE